MTNKTKKTGSTGVWIPVESITQYCNPYEGEPWTGNNHTFTKQEVWQRVESNLVEKTPYSKHVEKYRSEGWKDWDLETHMRRVAYLLKNGWRANTNPIQLDIGVLGYTDPDWWFVEDGNHRLAAAIARGDVKIKCEISGDIEYAEFLFGMELR